MRTQSLKLDTNYNSIYSSTCCATSKVNNKKVLSTSFKHRFDTEVSCSNFHNHDHTIFDHLWRWTNNLDFHHYCWVGQETNWCNSMVHRCSPKPNFLPGKQGHSNENYTVHYAPENFKMWSWGLTLLKLDNLLPLQFYMKSNSSEFKQPKNVFWQF